LQALTQTVEEAEADKARLGERARQVGVELDELTGRLSVSQQLAVDADTSCKELKEKLSLVS